MLLLRASLPPSLQGADLARAVGRRAAEGQRPHGYAAASEELFGTTDKIEGNVVLDAYTGALHAGVTGRETAWARKLSVEHTWPRSQGANGMAESDLHHLRAANSEANGARSSHPFGRVDPSRPVVWENARGPWTSRLGEDEQGDRVFEPPADVAGDIARGMFYFAVRYGTGLAGADGFRGASFLQALPTLLEMHANDPVSEAERIRNDRVERFQGNRNPFIDDPSLAERIGETGFRDALRGARGLRAARAPIAA